MPVTRKLVESPASVDSSLLNHNKTICAACGSRVRRTRWTAHIRWCRDPRSQKILEAQQTARAIAATQIEAKNEAEKTLEECAKNSKRIRKILEIAKYEQAGWAHGSSSIYEQPTLEPINSIAARVISSSPNPVRIEDFLLLDAIAVVPLILFSEQEFQDQYCCAHGLPKRNQASKGIDYYDPLSGFIEFTTSGKIDSKDISSYRQQAGTEPYKIVFVDGVPPNQTLAEALVTLDIAWEVFTPQAVA